MSDTVRNIVGPTILLSSGSYFDFKDPEGSDFTIEDIAKGLSNICRFTGHCSQFYSVAQHSVYVSNLVPPEDAYAGLMHDAAEAFIGDVSKPLKGMLPAYVEIENRVEEAIFRRFGVPRPMPASVKKADIVMLRTEQQQLMSNDDNWYATEGLSPADMKIRPWSPEIARRVFLNIFYALRGDA